MDFALDILAYGVVLLGARDGIGVDHWRALLDLADLRVAGPSQSRLGVGDELPLHCLFVRM